MKKEVRLFDDFGTYGSGFQYKVVNALIENVEFSEDVLNKINPKIFTIEPLRKVVETIQEYYNNNSKLPSWDSLSIYLKSRTVDDNEMLIMRDTFKTLKETDMSDVSDVIVFAREIINRLETLRVLDNARKSIKDGFTDDKLFNYVEQLQNINANSTDTSFDLMSFLDSDVDYSVKKKVETGIPELDKCMNGGLKCGTLGLLIAGTGYGKTTLSSIMCCNALELGYKVMHIFFEDTKSEIACKYYAHLTGLYSTEFEKPEVRKANKEKIYSKVPDLAKNLKLENMENGETTVQDIIAKVRHYERVEGWKPDMIFIDYFDCLRTSSNEKLRAEKSFEMQTRTIKQIESFAKKSGIAIWVAQQTNRNGLKSETASDRYSNVQGSIGLVQTSSAVLYLDRCGSELNYANLYLDKIRGGTPGEWTNIYLNNGTCQIDMSGENENFRNKCIEETGFEYEEENCN